MPIIIDTNCFSHVFSKASHRHQDFAPVKDWVINGKGMLVMGGTTYKTELGKAFKYLKIFNLLKLQGKVIVGNTKNIDSKEEDIYKTNNNKLFNDAHLVAISIDTKCQLICSEDKTSVPFVTDRKHYPQGFKLPVYYTSKKNSKLLSDNYVHDELKPLCKINKHQIAIIEKALNQ